MSEPEDGLVELPALRLYLLRRGWTRRPSDKSAFDIFALGVGKDEVEVLLPWAGQAKNPGRWVNAAIRTISQLREKTEHDLVAEVVSLSFDVLRSRISDVLVRGDTVSLRVATEFVVRMKSLIVAAATTELVPRPHFPRSLKDAKRYADECRFGHTFKGSFGFVLQSPVPSRDEAATLPGIEPVPPFARRVVERLARGVSTLTGAMAAGGSNAVVEDFGAGLSANMCDELVELVHATDGSGVELAFSLSDEWKPSLPLATFRPVILGPAEAEFLKDVSRNMREKRPPRPVTLRGNVVELRAQGVPGNLEDLESKRQITLAVTLDELGPIQVRVNLGPREYLDAIHAHEQGLNLRFEGNLEHIGRSWFLIDPRYVEDRRII